MPIEGQPIDHGERHAEWYRLHVVQRLTQKQIGARYGVAQQTVSHGIERYRKSLPPVDMGAVRAEALELFDEIERRAFELADMEGAPVTAGKDGDVVRDPETDAVVRDYAGRIAALKLALESSDRRRKLLGADAAQKVESTATVRYVVEGVDTSKLT